VTPNIRLVQDQRSRLRHSRVQLNKEGRRIVEKTIREVCDHRGWDLHALNVRSNHVHLAASCGEATPEAVMAQIKAWSTRRLREAGMVSQTARIWTRHGSTRYLWNAQSLSRAIEYILDRQGDDLKS